VVNASSLKSVDDAEVDIALQYAQSPAKVICHSPGRIPAGVFRLLLHCRVRFSKTFNEFIYIYTNFGNLSTVYVI